MDTKRSQNVFLWPTSNKIVWRRILSEVTYLIPFLKLSIWQHIIEIMSISKSDLSERHKIRFYRNYHWTVLVKASLGGITNLSPFYIAGGDLFWDDVDEWPFGWKIFLVACWLGRWYTVVIIRASNREMKWTSLY